MSEDCIILSGNSKGRETRFLLMSSRKWLRMPLNILEFTDHSPVPLPKPEIIQLELSIVPKWRDSAEDPGLHRGRNSDA